MKTLILEILTYTGVSFYMITGMCIMLFINIWFDLFQRYKSGYYNGHIDALRGKIKYELKRNEWGEEVWTEIKEEEKK